MASNSATKDIDIKTSLTFDDDVIRKIVGITAAGVDGIVSLNGSTLNELADSVTAGTDPKKGVSADVGDNQVSLKLNATIRYGTSARELFHEVVRKSSQALEQMTGLHLVQLDMTIDDIKTKEELGEDSDKDKK